MIGAAEVLWGVAGIAFWRWGGFFVLSGMLMVAALVEVALRSPAYLSAAFNPVTLNLGVMGLSLAGYFAGKETPSAARCMFRRPK